MRSSICSHMEQLSGEPDPGQICWQGKGLQPAPSPAPALPDKARLSARLQHTPCPSQQCASNSASAGPHFCWPLGESWDSVQAPQLPGSWAQGSHLISSELMSW